MQREGFDPYSSLSISYRVSSEFYIQSFFSKTCFISLFSASLLFLLFEFLVRS